jgi:hypothetical protein
MLGLRRRDLVVWIAYCAMLALVVPWHEPWSDEAQAWLLARDLSLPQLVFHQLRYESHPPLWYLILWLPAHLHLPYAAMSWISAAIAAAGIYVLLRYAPFPFYVRAILPFTFFLAYQYAVVARSYGLFPLLCFLVAHTYRASPPRPLRMAVLLALLANVSIHGTLVACAFALVYAWELFEQRDTVMLSARNLTGAAMLFAASIVLVAVTIRPPASLHTVASPGVVDAMHLRLHHVPDATPQDQATATASAQPVANGPATTGSTKDHLLARLGDLPRILSYPVSSSHMLAFVVYLYVVVYLYAREQFLLLAPLAVLAAFLGLVYARDWHLGMLWVVLLSVLWAAWDADADRTSFTLQNALAGLLVFVALVQLPWTARALRYDRRAQYYPATQTAAYLHTLPAGERIAGFGDVNTVLPYFRSNIFYNLPTSFNPNRSDDTVFADAPQTIALHPDLIVAWSHDDGILATASAAGYRETHRFCGTLYMPEDTLPEACYVILEPPATPL